ncbi:hypothetical protein H0H92_015859 [Tricholoma furcatifolium]|nr:hypothetical protein H0H92_015859 [Tricholoma furcatifolium]
MFAEDLKPALDKDYDAYVKSVGPNEKVRTNLAWSMPILKEKLENASQDVKDEVEAYQASARDEDPDMNRRYQNNA